MAGPDAQDPTALPPTTLPPTTLPRPPGALLGRPAPWAGLVDARRRGLRLDDVVGALLAAGRGLDVAAPEPLDELHGVDVAATTTLRDGAVLVALFEEAGEARVVLTRRSALLRRHRGEVAFPGGRLEPDEAPLAAALREADEEVGLAPGEVTPLAWLRPIVTFASGSIIRPYVGVLEARPVLRADPSEVARVFDVALAELVADGVFREERWPRPTRPGASDATFPIFVFEVDGETVWGATARVLTELCCLATGTAPR